MAQNTRNRYSFEKQMPRNQIKDMKETRFSMTPQPDYYNNDPQPEIYVNANFSTSKDESETNSNANTFTVIDINSNEMKENERDFINSISHNVFHFIKRYKKWFLYLLLIAYNVYLFFAIYLTWFKATSWCEGVKFLVVITGISYFIALYYTIFKRFLILPLHRHLIQPIIKSDTIPIPKKYIPKIIWFIVIASAVAFVVWDSSDEPMRIASGGGLIGFIFLGYIFSKHRSHIVWNQVLWGVALQFTFGIITLRWSFGKEVFSCIGDKISAFLEFTDSGSSFIFGYLVTGVLEGKFENVTVGSNSSAILTMPVQSAVFAFKVLPVIIFFSFFISILYFYGVMQIVVMKVGWFLQKTVGTTACESLNASGNIFLGMTEAPLMIRPFLPIMTKSELHAVMTGGFATIAGSVMAAYINFGVNPSHLLSASVMSAPAALAYSKLCYPETEVSRTSSKDISVGQSTERNALEAGSNGASVAVKLIANIVANLIAFLAFIAFLDTLISWFGSLVDYPELNFKLILSKIFVPFSLMMGINWEECDQVSTLIGLKTVINEFVAYQELGEMIKAGKISKRAQTVSTYALCGFSNFGSIGIQLGSLGALAPQRKSDLASIALRAMIAGSAACFMTACIAGMLIPDEDVNHHFHHEINATDTTFSMF